MISPCVHCRNNTHAIEDCLDLIAKWENHSRQRGASLINYEPRDRVDRDGTNISIITRCGTNTSADVGRPYQINIQKAIPENTKYDLVKKK
jgi:hypothetical protein